jgi:hypothetical protein
MDQGIKNTILLWTTLIVVVAAWSWFSARSKKYHEDKFNQAIREQLEADRKEFELDARSRAEILEKREALVESLKENLKFGHLRGRQWLAKFIADAEKSIDDSVIESLTTKQRPAPKAAEAVAAANAERRKYKERLKFLEYQLQSYKEYFPFLAEYEEVLLDDFIEFNSSDDIETAGADIDPVFKYIDKSDFQTLNERERNQLALDRYLNSKLSPLAIGRMYERYVGHLYERDGWLVDYEGIVKGLDDLGRDLICTKGTDVHIVQLKCWAREKLIHEKHIFQLFGTTQLYLMNKNNNGLFPMNVQPTFITSTRLSDVAKNAANWLKITIKEDFPLDKSFPMIKCNINQGTGERIYHLPFDQQYDRTKIITTAGEMYARTVAEAENAGFRRAFRFSGLVKDRQPI